MKLFKAKRLLFILSLLVLTVCLTACGGEEDPPATTAATTPAPSGTMAATSGTTDPTEPSDTTVTDPTAPTQPSDTTATEGLTFAENSDGSYTVIGIGTATGSVLRIPQKYKGKPVTAIGSSAFSDCTGLTSIDIPDSVTSIGYSAFENCTGLTSITFEDTDTWYRTTSNRYTGGNQISVTSPSQNATYFTDTYVYYYWYKN